MKKPFCSSKHFNNNMYCMKITQLICEAWICIGNWLIGFSGVCGNLLTDFSWIIFFIFLDYFFLCNSYADLVLFRENFFLYLIYKKVFWRQ